MPAKRIPRRKDPEPGTVILVRLPEHGCAYVFVGRSILACWLYDFITDIPTQNAKYFDKSHWLLPLILPSFPATYVDVCRIKVREKDLWLPPLVKWRRPDQAKLRGDPTPYAVRAPFGGYDYVTEEVARTMYREICLHSIEELEPFIMEHLAELRRVEVPPEDRWDAPARWKAPRRNWGEDEPGQISVELPDRLPTSMDLEDDIIGLLADPLIGKGWGGLIARDHLGDDTWEVLLEVGAGKMRDALRHVIETLVLMGAPRGTKVVEFREDRQNGRRHRLPKREELGLAPDACLMLGDHKWEDLVAEASKPKPPQPPPLPKTVRADPVPEPRRVPPEEVNLRAELGPEEESLRLVCDPVPGAERYHWVLLEAGNRPGRLGKEGPSEGPSKVFRMLDSGREYEFWMCASAGGRDLLITNSATARCP